VTVYGNTVRWSGSAVATVVHAELRGPGGLKATAMTRGIPGVLNFTSAVPGVDARILPGDEVTILPENGAAVTVTVPLLIVDVDAGNDRIAGQAPPGAAIKVFGNPDDDAWSQVRAGGDGAFALDLAGKRDLVPGDLGLVQWAVPDDIVFIAWWEVLSVELAPDARRLTLRTSVGSTLSLTIQPPGEPPRTTVHTPTQSSLVHTNQYDDGPRLVAGTRVTMTKRSAVPGMDHEWSGTIPELAVRMDRQANVVRGRGPAGSTLSVRTALYTEARLQRWSVNESVILDSAGSFALELDGRAELRPGWVAELRWEPDRAVTVIRQDVLRLFNVALHGYAIDLVVGPRHPVTVTLSAEDGSVLGQQVTTSTIDGEASIWYGDVRGPSGASVEPGAVISIDEYSTGDPVTTQVPAVTVRTDPTTDTISGEAPDGFEIVADTPGGTIHRSAVWDNGNYVADFSGTSDIATGTAGAIVFRQQSGPFEFHSGWCAARIKMMLGVADSSSASGLGAFLSGDGTPGRTVRVLWYAPDNRLVSTGEARVAPAIIQETGRLMSWTTNLPDSVGFTQSMLPGDRFVIEVGDDHLELTVPELTIEADVAANALFGRALPDTTVGIGAGHKMGNNGGVDLSTTAHADVGGNYRVEVGAKYDILHRDGLFASLTLPAGHTIRRYSEAPGLLVDLNEGAVRTVTLRNAEVIATLNGASGRRATTTTRSQSDGEVMTVFSLSDGSPVVPAAGDIVSLTATTPDAHDALSLTVPELSFQPDVPQNSVTGRATPGGKLLVEMAGALFPHVGIDGPGTDGFAWPMIHPDGTWQVLARDVDGVGGAMKLQAGLQLRITYRLADGNVVRLSQYLPMVNAEHGGARMCGVGPAGSSVEASVQDGAGAELARAAGHVAWNQRFDLILRRPDGRPMATRTGQTVRVVMGDETIEVALPSLSVKVMWDATLPTYGRPVTNVSGIGPPLRRTYVVAPALDCLSGAQPTVGMEFYGTENGEDPTFDEDIAHQSGGGGLQVAFFTPDYNRFFRQATRTRARIYVDTDRIVGRATPLQPVTLTLQSASGLERSTAALEADAVGVFTQHLADIRHVPTIIRPGDRVRLQASDGSSDILVEPLTFDFGVSVGLIGVTRPRGLVHIAYTLTDGTIHRFDRLAGADGRFRFGTDDVPPREGWTLRDVLGIEVVLPVTGGHEVVAEVDMGGRNPIAMYLPFTVVPRRQR
jgi:hypothetical protein